MNPTDLIQALETAIRVAGHARQEWDRAPSGMKAGKLLIALSDPTLRYRADIDEMHAALAAAKAGAPRPSSDRQDLLQAFTELVGAAEAAGWDFDANAEVLQRGREACATLKAGWFMPPPDAMVMLPDGDVVAAMFYFAAAYYDLGDIAAKQGFDCRSIRMEDDLGTDDQICQDYDTGDGEAIARWTPSTQDGWQFAAKQDTDDGPIALFIRRRPA